MEKVSDLLEATACHSVRPAVLTLELARWSRGRGDAQAQEDCGYTENYSLRVPGPSSASPPRAGVSYFENTQLRRLKETRSLTFPLDGAISPNPPAIPPIYKINTIQRLPKPHHIIAARRLPLKISIWGN